MPNTDAESVDDIVAANSSEGKNAKWMFVHDIPDNHQINSPVISAVKRTPIVDNSNPGTMIGRIADSFVPIPPENKMIHNAIIPINWAECILLNCIPSPLEPNPMPTSRNTNNNGKPM